MKFDYKKVAPNVLRPIIPIEIGNNFFVPYEVLVDSGADECVFDAGIGELIGLDVLRGEKKSVYGVTGANPEQYYIHALNMKVGGWAFKIKAGFLPGLSSRYSYGIVGQRGFFDLFVVKFDLVKETVELTERKSR